MSRNNHTHLISEFHYHISHPQYKNRTGAYIDADEDNIPDIVESLLSNNSTFVKFAEWALNNDIKLWRAYNWTIVYLYSIRNHISFADNEELLNDSLHGKDEIKTQIGKWERDNPYNKSCAENATQWLRDEFNPLITESMPPVITQFAAVSDVGFFYAYTKVSVELRDPSGIGTIRLISKPEKNLPLIYDIRVFDANGATIWKIKNLKLNITADAAAYHYFVVCNASDSLGNTAQWIKKVNGPVGAFVDTVAKLLSALWGFLCEVGETLAKAVSILVDWIIDQITSIITATFGPIKDAMEGYVLGVANSIIVAYNEYASTGTLSDKTLAKINSAFSAPLYWAVVGLSVAIITALTIAMPFTATFSTLGGILISIIVGLVMERIFNSEIREGKSVSGLSPDMTLSEIFEWIKQYISGKRTVKRSSVSNTELLLSVFGFIISWFGFIGSIAIFCIAKDEETGVTAALVSLVFTLLSVIFGFFGGIVFLDKKDISTVLSVAGIVFGALGIVFGMLATWGIPSASLAGKVSTVISLIGLLFSVTSLII